MRRRGGFTVVELIIVIVVIGILLVLGTVVFARYQRDARNKEREADVQAIALQLEALYPRFIKERGSVPDKPSGSYPFIACQHIELTDQYAVCGDDKDHNSTVLMKAVGEVGSSALVAPGDSGQSSFVVPMRRAYAQPWVLDYAEDIPAASSLAKRYFYRPENGKGEICSPTDAANEGCRSFTIYYAIEKPDGTYERRQLGSTRK